ncbi:MAG: uroporphyrinogen-III C-methyltransferase [Chromatiales bacterium]|nr:uroporphyrinogen-III C-methyltransferase [Chromatiales bacterium]
MNDNVNDDKNTAIGQTQADTAKPDSAPETKAGDKPAPAKPAAADPRPSHRGSGPAGLALLLALAALGAAGWLYWQFDQRLAAQDRTADELRQSLTRMEGDTGVADLRRELRAEVGQLRADAEVRDTRQSAAEEALARMQEITTRGQREWRLAEVRHLLRVAHQRLHLMQDIDGTVDALRAADRTLAEIADPRLLAARERLATDMQAVLTVQRPDVDGAALRLKMLTAQAGLLPLRGLETERGESVAAPAEDAPWWQRAWHEVMQQLRTYVTVRRHDQPVRALPDTETERLLRLVLVLRLETARLAALRLDDAAYHAELAAVRELLTTHFQDDASRGVQDEIADLDRLSLELELPDVTGTLTLLERQPAATNGGNERNP